MCFSATANFVGSGIIAAVGVATLTRVKDPRETLFASMPLLFAVHQLLEGFVWLGLDGMMSETVLNGTAAGFMLYAQGLLPIILPLSILLIEPNPSRRKWIWPFVALGVALGVYILWALTAFDTEVYNRNHSVVYYNPGTSHGAVATFYVIATCGSLFFSGYRYIIGLGVLNLIGLVVVLILRAYAFTSIWCAYAAAVSVLIYWHFHRRRAAERHRLQLQH
jgi:hypothetical protein